MVAVVWGFAAAFVGHAGGDMAIGLLVAILQGQLQLSSSRLVQ